MLTTGRDYTRDEIHAYLGGSKQSYLPSKDGEVVAACLTKKLNPQAPEVILCGVGKLIIQAGEALAKQRTSIPVFIKREVNRWEYRGHYRVARSLISGSDFDHYVSGSGRPSSDVSRVIVLEAVEDQPQPPPSPHQA